MLPQILHFDFGEDAVNSGDMATANCAVTKGDFPINITWLFNGKSIDPSAGITILQANKRISTITIESVGADHSGEYACTASNKAGTTSYSSTLNVNGTLFLLWLALLAYRKPRITKIMYLFPEISLNFSITFWFLCL